MRNVVLATVITFSALWALSASAETKLQGGTSKARDFFEGVEYIYNFAKTKIEQNLQSEGATTPIVLPDTRPVARSAGKHLFLDKYLFKAEIINGVTKSFTSNTSSYWRGLSIAAELALLSMLSEAPSVKQTARENAIYLDASKKQEAIGESEFLNLVDVQIISNPRAVRFVFENFSKNICEGAKAGLQAVSAGGSQEFVAYLKDQLETAKRLQQEPDSVRSQIVFQLAKESPDGKLENIEVAGRPPKWAKKSDLEDGLTQFLRKTASDAVTTANPLSKAKLQELSDDQRAYYEAVYKRYVIAYSLDSKLDYVHLGGAIPAYDDFIYPKSFAGFLVRRCLRSEALEYSCSEIMKEWIVGVEKVQTLFEKDCI